MKKALNKIAMDTLVEALLNANFSFTENEITDFNENDDRTINITMNNFSFDIKYEIDHFIIHTKCNRYILLRLAEDVIDYLEMMKRVDKILKKAIAVKFYE